ncbi:unnamed protein product [Trichobilharzia szidati]|nr:unnamed protein product [Trichobilharzia szidati]
MEQPSIQTTASESSGDTEPLTLSNNNNNKSLRRTTRNAPKSHLCCKCELAESSMRTKSSHVNVSPTITLNTQSLSVNLKETSVNAPQMSPTRSTLTTIPGMTTKLSTSTPVTTTYIPTKGTVNSRHKSVRATRSKGVRSERRSKSISDVHSYSLRGNSLNMLRYACINNLSIGKHLFLPHEYYLTTLSSSSSSVKVEKEVNSLDIDPPFKRYKNSTSVLRALISCVQPIPEAPHFQLGPDFTYLSIFRSRYHLLARAKGRLAARVSARDFFPNDITTLSKETPRIDRWVPIQTPDDIIKRAVDGSLSNDEAMDRLILLLAPKHSWKLYNDIAPDHKWTPDTLHRLLDLLCVTNGGEGGFYSHLLLDDYNWSSLPDPDEVYLADNFMIFNRSINDAQSTTGQKDTDSETVDKVDDITEPTTASLSKHSNIWNMQTTAECLFHKEHTTLNTPQAYRSIIRGAARFKNADRALEVAKMAWSSKYGDKCLDIATYSLLIRSLHGLTTVKTGKENVWDVILNILEHVKTCGEPINISIYTNILYTLAQTTVMLKSSSSSSSPASSSPSSLNYNYVPIGLGILGEVRRLNLKPELGTLANLLLLIYETPVPVNQQSSITSKDGINEKAGKKSLMNRPTYASYKCSNLLNQFLDDLEVYFNNNAVSVNRNSTTITDTYSGGSPKRFDAWTIDDYSFFPIAMKCALNEVNIELGERIHHLLTHYEDRTFLFSSSKMKYHYTHDYCKLMFYYEKYDQKLNSQLVQRYYNTYCQYFNVIISSKLLVEYLMKRYTNILKLFTDDKTKKNQQKKLPTSNQLKEINTLKVTVYSYLCRLLDDILNIEIHYYLQKSLDTVEQLTSLLCDYATLNPIDALDTSAKVLHIFQKLDNDFLKSTNTNTKK